MNWFAIENEIKYRRMELEKEMQRRVNGKGIDGSTPKKGNIFRKIINLIQLQLLFKNSTAKSSPCHTGFDPSSRQTIH